MMMCHLSRPLVQQAEEGADAADAHMSAGKKVMISRAAAKMTNFAAACELTSAEIWTGAEVWTLAMTAIDLFGASVSKFAKKFTSYSIRDIGANAARTSNRTLDWKRAMHILSHKAAPQREWNERTNR